MLRPKEVVQLWVDAFNNHDVEAITALYHENATNHQVANEPVVGIEAIRTMFTAEFSTAFYQCNYSQRDTHCSYIFHNGLGHQWL